MKKPDDFFAPRPKLSLNARIIQGVALLTATGISAWFLWLDYEAILTLGDKPDALLRVTLLIFINTFLQMLLLIPCWRLWLLKRWAVAILMEILVIGGFAFFFLLSVGQAFALPLMIIAFFVLWILGQEWPHLKSGF